MKYSLSIILAFLFLTGCRNASQADKVEKFIPGTYVSSWETEYNETCDTIIIEPLMKQGSKGYKVSRTSRITFQKSDNSRKPTIQNKQSTAMYDEANKILIVANDENVLSFDPLNNEMKRGTTSYKKLR